MPRSELPPHNNTPRLNGMVVYGSNDTADRPDHFRLKRLQQLDPDYRCCIRGQH